MARPLGMRGVKKCSAVATRCMSDPWLADTEMLNSFLQFGYVPREPTLDPYLRGVDLDGRHGGDRDALVERGEAALAEAFDGCIDEVGGRIHVLPLSGGLDSRTILGELLGRVGKERIRTVTFGTPGTWDYDIPKTITERYDLDSEFLELRPDTFRWSNEFVAAHCDYRRPVPVIERTVNRYSRELLADEDVVFWSGFNVETGAIAATSHGRWERAVSEFVSRNTVSSSLAAETFDAESVVPDEPLLPRERLPFDQQLDYALRQEYYSKPLLLPETDLELAVPFMERSWREFCLTVAPRYRRDRRVFKEIVGRRHPELFEIPVEAHYGLGLRAPKPLRVLKGLAYAARERLPAAVGGRFDHPRLNYYDFDALFRHGAVRRWVEGNLDDLSSREEVDWIRPTDLWERHVGGEPLGTEIRLLLSLELYFKMHAGD